jgi:GeoRSP system SPASM domain protein
LKLLDPLKGCSVSFRPTQDTVEDVPELLATCLDRGIPELQLPMERLISGEQPLCLSRARQEDLSSRLTAIPFNGRIALTIHDPFLWRAFYPDTPFPDGSCQAGNTMLSIDPSGNVYPCPAMPFRLGSLLEKHFREIVASEEKRATRLLINSTPADCTTCRLFPGCRGGCRGRSYQLKGGWNAPDPACDILE